jgi:hypothetical protein
MENLRVGDQRLPLKERRHVIWMWQNSRQVETGNRQTDNGKGARTRKQTDIRRYIATRAGDHFMHKGSHRKGSVMVIPR